MVIIWALSLVIIAVILVILFMSGSRTQEEKPLLLKELESLEHVLLLNSVQQKTKNRMPFNEMLFFKHKKKVSTIGFFDGMRLNIENGVEIQKKLPLSFIRVHKHYWVNRSYVKQIESHTITFINSSELKLDYSK